MKNLMNMMAYAAIVLVGIFVSLTLTGCGADESYSSDNRVTPPAPRDTTKVTPTPDPKDPEPEVEPVDTTSWKTVGAKTLSVDENRLVTTIIYGLKQNESIDSLVLNYLLKFQLSAPDTVRLPQPGTELTKYAGSITSPSAHYEHKWEGKDSLCVVTTTKGYKTTFFNVVWETSHTLGWTLIKGMLEPYKYDIESSQAIFDGNSLQRYCEPYEVERNDSIYLREELRNVVQMTFHGRTFVEEKKVVVDHFIKVKESEKKEEETINADVWVDGLGRMVSLTRGIREDTRNPCDFALFEGSTGYTIIIDTYSTEGKYLSTETDFHSFDECPKSNDYDGVAYIKGKFYPGAITYDYKKSDEGSHDWVVTCYINKKVEQQRISGQDAVMRGIKNFKENNSAYPWPYLTNASTSKEVNGKKVITVNGKTSEGRAVKQHIVADSLLKK